MSENIKAEKSEALFSKAVKVMPGGISRNTVYRTPFPHYVAKASGSKIIDADGVERTDFANNMAAHIHGHSHPAIVNAVIEQIKKGTAYTMASEIEVDYAELLCSRVPGIEKIRFVNSGTEAVMAMIKASRAFTGRHMIAKAEGAYHGTYDYAEVSQTANPSNWGDPGSPNSVPVASYTPPGVLADVVVFPFNDLEKTISILERHKGKLACILIDPVPHRIGLLPASQQFITGLYEWTRKDGSLLVFDEVVTFRVNYSGAQENYPVRPDMTSFGKIIGGGFPVGAFGGKSEIMNVLDPRVTPLPFPHSGTFSANPVTMTAGFTAMKLFNREAVNSLNRLTESAISGIKDAISVAGVPVSVTGAGSMFRIHLQPNPPKTYREAYQSKETLAVLKKIIDHMFYEEKILMINTLACMFSTVLTDTDVENLTKGLLNAFRRFSPEIEKLNSAK